MHHSGCSNRDSGRSKSIPSFPMQPALPNAQCPSWLTYLLLTTRGIQTTCYPHRYRQFIWLPGPQYLSDKTRPVRWHQNTPTGLHRPRFRVRVEAIDQSLPDRLPRTLITAAPLFAARHYKFLPKFATAHSTKQL